MSSEIKEEAEAEKKKTVQAEIDESTLPQANTLFIGAIPPWSGWSTEQQIFVPQIIDVDHSHPLMAWVEMGDITIYEAIPLKPPPGSKALIDSNSGTLLAIGARQGFQDAVLGFGLLATDEQGTFRNTNWPRRSSFPLFMLNVLESLGGSRDIHSVRPGEAVVLKNKQNVSNKMGEKVKVETPSGERLSLRQQPDNTLTFTQTEQAGIYQVLSNEEISQYFVVNFLDRTESDIRPRKSNMIRIGYTQVEGQTNWQPTRTKAWKLVLALVLAVIVFEWYIYVRRVRV